MRKIMTIWIIVMLFSVNIAFAELQDVCGQSFDDSVLVTAEQPDCEPGFTEEVIGQCNDAVYYRCVENTIDEEPVVTEEAYEDPAYNTPECDVQVGPDTQASQTKPTENSCGADELLMINGECNGLWYYDCVTQQVAEEPQVAEQEDPYIPPQAERNEPEEEDDNSGLMQLLMPWLGPAGILGLLGLKQRNDAIRRQQEAQEEAKKRAEEEAKRMAEEEAKSRGTYNVGQKEGCAFINDPSAYQRPYNEITNGFMCQKSPCGSTESRLGTKLCESVYGGFIEKKNAEGKKVEFSGDSQDMFKKYITSQKGANIPSESIGIGACGMNKKSFETKWKNLVSQYKSQISKCESSCKTVGDSQECIVLVSNYKKAFNGLLREGEKGEKNAQRYASTVKDAYSENTLATGLSGSVPDAELNDWAARVKTPEAVLGLSEEQYNALGDKPGFGTRVADIFSYDNLKKVTGSDEGVVDSYKQLDAKDFIIHSIPEDARKRLGGEIKAFGQKSANPPVNADDKKQMQSLGDKMANMRRGTN